MKKRDAIVYKLHYWISFTINIAFTLIVNVLQKNESIPFYIIIVAVLSIGSEGALRLFHDFNIRDFSISTLIVDYFGVIVMSGLLIYFLFDDYLEYYALQLFIICIIEASIFPIIYHRNKIKNKLKKMFCKKQ